MTDVQGVSAQGLRYEGLPVNREGGTERAIALVGFTTLS